MADKVDIAERFSVLQMLQYVRRYGLDVLEDWLRVRGAQKNPLAAIGRGLAERGAGNDGLDASVSRVQQMVRPCGCRDADRGSAQTRKGIGPVRGRLSVKEKALQSGLTTESIGNIVICLFLPGFDKVQTAQDRVEQSRRNLYVAFALAAYRADTDRYPAKLDELAPKYLTTVPGDLFSGRPLIYRPNAAGYLLYSVGPNGIDDGGRFYDDDPAGDDIGVRMPLPELKLKK